MVTISTSVDVDYREMLMRRYIPAEIDSDFSTGMKSGSAVRSIPKKIEKGIFQPAIMEPTFPAGTFA